MHIVAQADSLLIIQLETVYLNVLRDFMLKQSIIHVLPIAPPVIMLITILIIAKAFAILNCFFSLTIQHGSAYPHVQLHPIFMLTLIPNFVPFHALEDYSLITIHVPACRPSTAQMAPLEIRILIAV